MRMFDVQGLEIDAPRHKVFEFLPTIHRSAARRAINILIAEAVTAIAHPADLLSPGTNRRQPFETRRAIKRVQENTRTPRRTIIRAFRYIQVIDGTRCEWVVGTRREEHHVAVGRQRRTIVVTFGIDGRRQSHFRPEWLVGGAASRHDTGAL